MPSARRAQFRELQRRHREVAAVALAMAGTATCSVCGQLVRADEPWDLDHVIPLAMGGTNHRANLAVAHRACNRQGKRLALPVPSRW